MLSRNTSRLIALGAATMLVACAQIASLRDDYFEQDAIPDGSSEGAGGDGAPSQNDATTDGSGLTDASGDADAGGGDAGDGASPVLCPAGAHWFCDDFEQNTTLSEFSLRDVTGTGAVSVAVPTGAAAPSPTHAFLGEAATGDHARVFFSNATVASVLHCELDLRMDVRSSTAGNGVYVADLHLADSSSGANYGLALHLFPTGSDGVEQGGQLADGGGLAAIESYFTPFALGTWRHVTMELGVGASARASVKIDGVSAATAAYDLSGVPKGVATINIGPLSYDGAWKIRIDNVVCDTTP